uniref:ATP synthase complex subunit 8 n=1 Tax=Centromochlus existimatus TaxID=1258684 RepID=K9N2L4_CENES|nr:ATPase subunit 8 [Centromochlus existimatus]AFY11283.1 ATPase subunit 8 [Centromochlus existimatus]AFY11293.1 ATPase subunit 8 [Centromochlus existimatus]AFY11299.1 ATPase subunit 8 [Centromochlus existimatus]AFY11309.1 ATPase subunit 8 [Centromochlus existimatus]
MPQLNPAPWFAILVLSWLIFLTVVPQKVMNHSFTNEITALSTKSLKSDIWNWPWH